MPIALVDGGIFTVFPAALPTFDYTADPTNYTGIVAGATSGETVGLLAGVYLNGLTPPSGVTITAISGLGSVNFTSGTIGGTYSNGCIKMQNTGSTINGLIAHDPNDKNSHAIFVTGDFNSILNCAAYNGGSHKHKLPCFITGSNNLIEDSFFFGEGRYCFQLFTCSNNIIRRCVARWDSTALGFLTEPDAAFANYNTDGNFWENCISIDYAYTPEDMRFGGDFYSPHNEGVWPPGNNNNGWYGCVVVYHDKTNDSGKHNNRAFRADDNSSNLTNSLGNIIKDFYIRGSVIDILIKFNYGFDIDAVSRYDVKFELADGNFSPRSNMLAAPGADIDFEYINGVKTSTPVWPFKHEAVMKIEMAKVPNGNRGWVTSGKTLENYVKNI